MTEHDPIREWSAQKERAEFLLYVCSEVRDGLPGDVGAVALQVAGVSVDLVGGAINAAEMHRRATLEAKGKADDRDPPLDQAAEIISDAVRDGLLDSCTGLRDMALSWLGHYEAQHAAATYPGRPVDDAGT